MITIDGVKYSKQQLLAIRAALVDLSLEPDPIHIGAGICMNISEAVTRAGVYTFVSYMAVGWNKCKSAFQDPIHYVEPFWEGEHLALRLSLIDHLIRKIDEATDFVPR